MKILFRNILLCSFLFFGLPLSSSCSKKNCPTYSSSHTTGKLSKSVAKKNKSYKKKAKKSGGKIKQGKPLI